MATGDKVVSLFVDCLLSKTSLKERFLEFLSSKVDEVIAAVLQGRSGTLDSDKVGLAADGTDRFKLDLSVASKVAVGGGQVIDLSRNDVLYHTQQIYFENTVAVVYEVGVKYAQVPEELDIHPRKGTPQYTALLETFGETGNPDSLTDTFGVSLKVVVDSLCESGVSHAGRQARVWLVTPQSASKAVAFYEGTILWDGVNNYLLIPYAGASGPLGQNTAAAPPSTTPADYMVWVFGPTVRRNSSIKSDYTYAFIGEVTGAGAGVAPAFFSTADQFAVFWLSLDSAYDGIGSGGGRVILVDSGAMELRGYTGQALDPTSDIILQHKDYRSNKFQEVLACGRIAQVEGFSDDFQYDPAVWTNAASVPAHTYTAVENASGLARCKPLLAGPALDEWSLVDLLADDANGASYGEITSIARIKTKDQLPGLFARFAVSRVDFGQYFMAMLSGEGTNEAFGVRIMNGTVYAWTQDAAAVSTFTTTGHTLAADIIYDLYCVAKEHNKIEVWVTGMAAPYEMSLSWSLNGSSPRLMNFYAKAANDNVDASGDYRLMIDYIHCWVPGRLK